MIKKTLWQIYENNQSKMIILWLPSLHIYQAISFKQNLKRNASIFPLLDDFTYNQSYF